LCSSNSRWYHKEFFLEERGVQNENGDPEYVHEEAQIKLGTADTSQEILRESILRVAGWQWIRCEDDSLP